jgi:hypothetical protein
MRRNSSDMALKFKTKLREGHDVFDGGYLVESKDSERSLECGCNTVAERGADFVPIIGAQA